MLILNYGNRVDLMIERVQKTMGLDRGFLLRQKRMNQSPKRDPKVMEGCKMQLVSACTFVSSSSLFRSLLKARNDCLILLPSQPDIRKGP